MHFKMNWEQNNSKDLITHQVGNIYIYCLISFAYLKILFYWSERYVKEIVCFGNLGTVHTFMGEQLVFCEKCYYENNYSGTVTWPIPVSQWQFDYKTRPWLPGGRKSKASPRNQNPKLTVWPQYKIYHSIFSQN